MAQSKRSPSPSPTPPRRWRELLNRKRLLNPLLGALVLLVLVGFAGWWAINEFFMDSPGVQEKKSDDPSGSFQLDRVEIVQSGEPHPVLPGKFHGQVEDLVLEPGLAALALWFKAEGGEPASGEVTLVNEARERWPQELDSDGHVVFLLELALDGQDWRFEPYKLKVGEQEREFSLLAIYRFSSGNVSNMVNTPSEMGVSPSSDQPQTVEFEVDPTFVRAFAQFCGFAVEDVAKVRLEPNERQRFQVAWTGREFVQSRQAIAVGQPVWVAISAQGDRCYINPPCGNPEVPEGKLPLASPELQPAPIRVVVPTPTRTPVTPLLVTVTPTSPVPPTATPTATLPPGVTPSPTPPVVESPTPTSTPTATGTRSAESPTATKTAAKTPTVTKTPIKTATVNPTATPTAARPNPPLVIFSGFVQHGENLCEWRGVFTASQDVSWFVSGGQVVSQDSRNLTVDVQSSVGNTSSVTVTASNANGSNARTETTPLCSPAENTPGPTRTPEPTWTTVPGATATPTPQTTPVPP